MSRFFGRLKPVWKLESRQSLTYGWMVGFADQTPTNRNITKIT